MEGWIARDKCGDIYFYTQCPYKNENMWNSSKNIYPVSTNLLPFGIDPQWEDENPIPVELFMIESNNL